MLALYVLCSAVCVALLILIVYRSRTEDEPPPPPWAPAAIVGLALIWPLLLAVGLAAAMFGND